MDRVSSWYKRRAQLTILVIGLFVAITVNVDTITVAKRLSTDDGLRDSLVAAATENTPRLMQTRRLLVQRLRQIQLIPRQSLLLGRLPRELNRRLLRELNRRLLRELNHRLLLLRELNRRLYPPALKIQTLPTVKARKNYRRLAKNRIQPSANAQRSFRRHAKTQLRTNARMQGH